jgi:hypothetical protein
VALEKLSRFTAVAAVDAQIRQRVSDSAARAPISPRLLRSCASRARYRDNHLTSTIARDIPPESSARPKTLVYDHTATAVPPAMQHHGGPRTPGGRAASLAGPRWTVWSPPLGPQNTMPAVPRPAAVARVSSTAMPRCIF